jgi:hypothetical protein
MNRRPIPEQRSRTRFAELPLTLKFGAVVAGLAPLVAIASYVLEFRHSGISTDPGAWAQLGDYIGGTLGWLLNLLLLVIMYVTYLTQQQTNANQQRRSDESIELLRAQTAHLKDQVDTVRQEAFDVQLWGLVSQLIQSILACRRDSKTLGTVVGHACFEQYGAMLWSAYVDSYNRKDKDRDRWRIARSDLLSGDEGNWCSVRGQIEFLVEFITTSSRLSDAQRRQAMTIVTNQLTPGIAVLFAVDTYLAGDTQLAKLAQEFGMFRSVEPQLQDALKETGAYDSSAFGVAARS